MLKIDIIYSRGFEINRVIDSFRQLEWFRENKYETTLPTGLKLLQKNSPSKNEIKKAVFEEFDDISFQEQKNFLTKNLEKVFSRAETEFIKIGMPIEKKYKIFLTKYGTGGGYCLPDKIIININLIRDENLLRTSVHEIVHLIIEPLISSYQIDHWTKERLADLIVSKISPSLINFQCLPINTETIDRIFNDNYPKISQAIQNIAKLDIENRK